MRESVLTTAQARTTPSPCAAAWWCAVPRRYRAEARCVVVETQRARPRTCGAALRRYRAGTGCAVGHQVGNTTQPRSSTGGAAWSARYCWCVPCVVVGRREEMVSR
jgi:hypothetical protein